MSPVYDAHIITSSKKRKKVPMMTTPTNPNSYSVERCNYVSTLLSDKTYVSESSKDRSSGSNRTANTVTSLNSESTCAGFTASSVHLQDVSNTDAVPTLASILGSDSRVPSPDQTAILEEIYDHVKRMAEYKSLLKVYNATVADTVRAQQTYLGSDMAGELEVHALGSICQGCHCYR